MNDSFIIYIERLELIDFFFPVIHWFMPSPVFLQEINQNTKIIFYPH